MKVKRILKFVIIMLSISILTILVRNYIYASSFKFVVSATKTRVKPGEETTVIMKISDIVDVNNLGINALEATLEYDSNIFETVTVNEMEGKNNWTITYNQQQGNFLVSNIISGIKSEQEIGEIKFKVKKNVGKTRTKIYFRNVKSNDGNNLMPEQDKEVEIIIDWDESITKEEGKNEVITIKNVTASGKIPQTGEENIAFVILAIVGVGIISYIRYRRIQIK